MGKVTFVAMLCIMAVISLLLGGDAAYQRLQYWWDGKEAVMVCHDPRLEKAIKLQIFDGMSANVDYVSSDGTITVTDKYLPETLVRRLGSGQSVAIRYLQGDPHEIVLRGQSLPNPWGWLITSVLSGIAAFWGWRMLRREMAGE